MKAAYWWFIVEGVAAAALVGWFLWRRFHNRPEVEKVPEWPREAFYIQVREGKRGLETYASERLSMMRTPYKRQIVAFLQETISHLEREVSEKGGKK
jgi:hypothetical protein